MLKLRLSSKADKDIDDILDWGKRRFGPLTAARYYELILQAIRDIRSDPHRIGSTTYPDLLIDDARIYPLRFSRTNVTGKAVGEPRHLLLYRVAQGILLVGRILHESRDLPRHVPKDFRR